MMTLFRHILTSVVSVVIHPLDKYFECHCGSEAERSHAKHGETNAHDCIHFGSMTLWVQAFSYSVPRGRNSRGDGELRWHVGSAAKGTLPPTLSKGWRSDV